MTKNVATVGTKNHLVSANIRFMRNPYQGRYIEIITCTESEEGNIRVASRNTLPKYDMALIGKNKSKFHSVDFDKKIYSACLMHPEGKRALNDLKNSITNKAVNSYLKIIKDEIKPDANKMAQGHVPTMKSALSMFEKTYLQGPNLLAHKSIGITREQIWEHFKNIGLIEKIKNTVI